mmetsp:Transcript_54482/g.88012  ORF Transcript_54482/g.88012 Transcript_54482/m.88012 type:complete len:222 (-) Transcript_54482:551-1216(-)
MTGLSAFGSCLTTATRERRTLRGSSAKMAVTRLGLATQKVIGSTAHPAGHPRDPALLLIAIRIRAGWTILLIAIRARAGGPARAREVLPAAKAARAIIRQRQQKEAAKEAKATSRRPTLDGGRQTLEAGRKSARLCAEHRHRTHGGKAARARMPRARRERGKHLQRARARNRRRAGRQKARAKARSDPERRSCQKGPQRATLKGSPVARVRTGAAAAKAVI